jgi:SOS-response transcriptional repressor LexA
MLTLTPEQRNFLQIPVRCMREHRSAATIREPQDAARLQSSRSVIQYLDALEAAGVIPRDDGSRNIRLITPTGASDPVRVPVVGRVAAGHRFLPKNTSSTRFQSPARSHAARTATTFTRSMATLWIAPGFTMVTSCLCASKNRLMI